MQGPLGRQRQESWVTDQEEWNRREQEKNANPSSIEVSVIIDGYRNTTAVLDTGNTTQSMIRESLVNKLCLPRIPLNDSVAITPFAGGKTYACSEITKFHLDMGGLTETHYAYIIPHLSDNLLIGYPWLKRWNASIDCGADKVHFKSIGVTISGKKSLPKLDVRRLNAAGFHHVARHAFKVTKEKVFAASLKDIKNTLSKLNLKLDPSDRSWEAKVPKWINPENQITFDKNALYTQRLPPHRPNVDHHIELTTTDDKVPWGPLYNMSRDELLVLRATLIDLLDKNFIRVSKSSAAAPVLFVKKPGGGLRFCVDYRALNDISKKDRYPLPRIVETLNRIAQAKWFTKLDVVAAFHAIRIAEGEEWKTAFRTRFGLFEWLVTPFGLTNAPSTFQRFINWVLREFLDIFASAYIDDILIFTEGSKEEHRKQVNQVLAKLREAGLTIDIDKCEFETQKTKYLGFILEPGKISMDPEKVEAVEKWEIPHSVKDVQTFLGFANFYRRFIPEFSKIAAPLSNLTKKDAPFKWTETTDQAFRELKKRFISSPILQMFDHLRRTVVETDASGYSIGAILLQADEKDVLHPVAYLSKKMRPEQANYPIHDKEMLAIVEALREWRGELKSVKDQFEIVSDHKNLKHFTAVQNLSERQPRWSQFLS